MLFENYKDEILYNSQSKISLPRSSKGGTRGYGSMVFLLCPSIDKAIEFVNAGVIDINNSATKRFMMDTIYREKIGSKTIKSVERTTIDGKFKGLKKFELIYVPSASRDATLDKGVNTFYDLSRWMELFFPNSEKFATKKKCYEFIRILKDKIERASFDSYSKLILFDLAIWSKSIKNCIILNKNLLNNPLSIIFYSAFHYPELFEDFPECKFMLTNSLSGQVFLFNLKGLDKARYNKIKPKLKPFKNLVYSVLDNEEPTAEEINIENRAEMVAEFKKEIKANLKAQLLGTENLFDDITPSVGEELGELEKELLSELDDETEDSEPADEMEERIDAIVSSEVDKVVEDQGDDILDLDSTSQKDIENKLAEGIRELTYTYSFMPERSPEELEKIKRLTEGQEKVLYRPTMSDIERKSIPKRKTGALLSENHNPGLQESAFVNFDQAYTEKCLEKNIDDAVGILSKASEKIFVTGKTVEDSSTPMALKKTYTYSLEDEFGAKFKLSFDVPEVIDGSYVFLNGTKKNIRHQFILKPIVKTSPNVVQLVTAYNKVFVYREGIMNQVMSKIIAHLDKNAPKFKVGAGNNFKTNGDYEMPLEFGMIAKYFDSFVIGDVTFYTSINNLCEKYKMRNKKELKFNKAKEIPIGINKKTGEVVMLDLGGSYSAMLFKYFSPDDIEAIHKIKRKPKVIFADAKMMGRRLPMVLFMLFCEGFASVMEKSKIKYHLVPEKKELKNYSPMEWDVIPLADGYIVWDKTILRNEIIMNGLKRCDMSDFNIADLEDKYTYISLILPFYPGNSKIHSALDNYRDFLLDDKTKEILQDFGYPTDLVSLLVVVAGLLSDNNYIIENDMRNMRIRSTEVIADLIYTEITSAYREYRNTAYKKKKATKPHIRKNAIINALLSSDTNMIEESSVLNPVYEIEKKRSVTFKGVRGIQMDRAMTFPRRAYDKSMLGTIGITTSPDANVGIVRQLTVEPAITSTYGYIDAERSNNLDSLQSANLFTPAELFHPIGITHNDPDRSAMQYKHTKYLVPITDSDPVMIGNHIESTLPYMVSDEFVVDAKQDGVVKSIENDYVIIEYADGTKQAIDISPRPRKNSSNGSWIDNTLKCTLKVGQKFKYGDILAYNPQHFTPNADDRGVSMNLGALCKIAIYSQWDIFEDSVPISRRLSQKTETVMVDEKHVSLSPHTRVDYIAKVGSTINAGDTLLRFTDATDELMQNLFDNLKDSARNTIIENSKTTIASKYTGTVMDIKIYTTQEIENLDPSLQEIAKDYHKRISKRNATLDKNSNPGDLGYYKAGQIITETDNVIKVEPNGKIAGYEVPEGWVLILFYIRYEVAASKGDKAVVSVCKGICSHVIEPGLEPYSEYRPDEIIDTVAAPLSVSARKIPEIFLTIFGNKCIIELKRQLKDIYKSVATLGQKRKTMMNRLLTAMKLLDPTGDNAKFYKDKFGAMSDQEFDAYFKKFFNNQKANFYLEIVEYERDLDINNIVKCAEFLKVPLLEYVACPYLSTDKDEVIVTPFPVPVGYIHQKRLPQTLMKKSSGSTKIQKRSPLTGQVTAEDKNARVSNMETFSMAALGAKDALREFMGPRADNMRAKSEMYNDIAKNGYVSLDDLTLDDPYNKSALNTMDCYYNMMGVKTNLITDFSYLPGPKDPVE